MCIIISLNRVSNVLKYWSESLGNKLIHETTSVNHFDIIN